MSVEVEGGRKCGSGGRECGSGDGGCGSGGGGRECGSGGGGREVRHVSVCGVCNVQQKRV